MFEIYLVKLISVDCMEFLLFANPWELPKRKDDLGIISFSDSLEAFVVVKSHENIGFEIDQSKRKINNLKLFSKFLIDKEKELLIS